MVNKSSVTMERVNIKEQDTFKYDVFISHSSASSLDFVKQLVKWFEIDNGISCWYAPRNLDSTGAGKDYDDELVSAIKDSHCMVVVLNDDSLVSKWVKHEVNQAEKRNMMIFPFAVSKLSVNNGLLMRLEDRHIIAAYPDPSEKFPLLLKNVKQLLGQDVSGIIVKEDFVNKVKSINDIDFDYEEGLAFLEVNHDKEAFLSFLNAAENGNKDAASKLVDIMRQDSKNAQFLDDSTWERIEELSDRGEWYADLLMHFKYYSMGTQNEIAIKYLRRSMKKYDSPISFLQLGICYGWGLGVPLSDVLALRYYEKALERNCGFACRYIGQLYMYGGNNIEKDLAKAEEYLKKGVEMSDVRSFELLFDLYCNMGENGEAKALAQQMIDQHVKGGYSLMGDYFLYCLQDQERAKDCYTEAVKHEENGAWGNLALLAWHNNEKDDAFRSARRGYLENDSRSFGLLGQIYESEGDLDKAWDFYHQEVLKFGMGEDGLAKLYFDNNYLPDNYKISDLKRDLELSAKKQNLESIKYLLRLMLLENGENSEVITYENIKDLSDSYEFLRIGAKEGDADMLFIYGRLLMESDGKLYNPYTGIDYIESAMEKGNKDAVTYLFNCRNKLSTKELSRLYQNIIKSRTYVGIETATVIGYYSEYDLPFIEWLYRSLKNLVWVNTFIFFDCFRVFRKAIESTITQVDVKNWLDKQVEDFVADYSDTSALVTPFYAYLLATKLSIGDETNDFDTLAVARIEINIDDEIGNLTKIPYFKDNVQMLWPDYDPDKILDGDFSNTRDLRIFYGVNSLSLPDVLIGGDETVSGINDYFSEDINYPYEVQGFNETRTKMFNCSYDKIIVYYQMLKDKGVISGFEDDYYCSISQTSVCCSISDTLEYCLNCLKMLIASRDAFGDVWQEIVGNLDNAIRLRDIAETVKDYETRELLYGYCDFIEARNELLMIDIQLEHSINNAYISSIINAIIDEIEENNIKHELQRITDDNIPDSIGDLKEAMRGFAGALRNYLTD